MRELLQKYGNRLFFWTGVVVVIGMVTAYRIVSATDTYNYDPTISASTKWADAIPSYRAE